MQEAIIGSDIVCAPEYEKKVEIYESDKFEE
jgi:hypothetical protein